MKELRGESLLAFPDILPRASEPEQNLAWEVARSVTGALVGGRNNLASTAVAATTHVRTAVGMLADAGGDVATYMDPARWLGDLYEILGLATRQSVDRIDDRIDYVELRVDQVARQRAREELLLLQQRIGELELILSQVKPAAQRETREAVGALVGRLSELETRIDAIPWRTFEAGAV